MSSFFATGHSCARQKAVGVLWASLRTEETHGHGYGYGYGYVKDGWMDGWIMVAGKVALVSRSGLAANGDGEAGRCAGSPMRKWIRDGWGRGGSSHGGST